jgi:hypothetical protein
MNMDLFAIVATFQSEFLMACGEDRRRSETLHFHMRSGDITMRNPTPFYGQPPCSYYLDASSFHSNDTEQYIFSESAENPCVNALIERGATLILNSVRETVQQLVHAEKFVLARSTFSFALVLLSEFSGKGQFYTFAYKWQDIGPHWNCVETKSYYEQVLAEWRYSPEQIALMRTAKCEKWSYVNETLEFYPYHGKDGTPFHF